MAVIELIGRKGSRKVNLYRCREDETLLTDLLISKGTCAGHIVKEYVKLTPWERIKLMLGVIK